mgnify:FL=1
MNKLISKLLSIYFLLYESIIIHFLRFFNKSPNNEDPLVSIIIATYNRSDILINRTIPSVLNQSYSNIELIIIGDKCIDDTPTLLKNYPDKRVVFYDLTERGRYPKHIKDRWFVQGSVPRNYGMSIAKGDWFVFISDDDIMLEHHIQTLVNFTKKNNFEFVSASYNSVKDNKLITVHPTPRTKKNILVGGMQTWMFRSFLRVFKWNRHSWRKIWNRPCDYDLLLRFINAGVKMGSLKEVISYNPPVEGTDTSGYEAALKADKL